MVSSSNPPCASISARRCPIRPRRGCTPPAVHSVSVLVLYRPRGERYVPCQIGSGPGEMNWIWPCFDVDKVQVRDNGRGTRFAQNKTGPFYIPLTDGRIRRRFAEMMRLIGGVREYVPSQVSRVKAPTRGGTMLIRWSYPRPLTGRPPSLVYLTMNSLGQGRKHCPPKIT